MIMIYNSDLLCCYYCISNYVVIIIYTINKVLIICLLSITLVNIGFIAVLIGVKVFISITLLVANIIIIYLWGLIAVIIYWFVYYSLLGLLLNAFIYYLFLTKHELFIFILFYLELVSILFQSLTLANRLSINLIAGSLLITLLISLLCLIIIYYVCFCFVILFNFIVYSFEIMNTTIQLFIYHLLSIEYSN